MRAFGIGDLETWRQDLRQRFIGGEARIWRLTGMSMVLVVFASFSLSLGNSWNSLTQLLVSAVSAVVVYAFWKSPSPWIAGSLGGALLILLVGLHGVKYSVNSMGVFTLGFFVLPHLSLFWAWSLFLWFPAPSFRMIARGMIVFITLAFGTWLQHTVESYFFAVLLVYFLMGLEAEWIQFQVFKIAAVANRKQGQLQKLAKEHEAHLQRSQEERDKLEFELFQARKMEALGQLAGGIAHDFNNVLAAISGYADLISKRYASKHEPIGKYTMIILDACSRASSMISQLLAYTRRGKYQRRLLDMHEQIHGVMRLLEHSLTSKVRVRFLLEAAQPWFAGDPDQFQNALLNMAINARDAMPDGGDLVLSTHVVPLDQEFARKYGFKVADGPYVCLEVADTGVGMETEIAQRIFEPFFTTKRGKGTGLGLAGVYGFVKSHNGYVTVDTKPGQGSIFRVYLPQSQQEPILDTNEDDNEPPFPESERKESAEGVVAITKSTGAFAAIVPDSTKIGKSLHVMVVDDEEPIRELLREMLQRQGFEVEIHSEAEDALQAFSADPHKWDLVLTDMIMPGMDGRDLYFKMREIRSDVRVLVVSGYSRNEVVQQLLDAGVKAHVTKPFRAAELIEVVRRALA